MPQLSGSTGAAASRVERVQCFSGWWFEVELLFLDFLRQFDAADRHGRRFESLEPKRWLRFAVLFAGGPARYYRAREGAVSGLVLRGRLKPPRSPDFGWWFG